VQFTDLTKVLLQGRRFFRPVDLETRGIRRVLRPFSGVISALGFAIAVGAFLWKDVVAEHAKDIVSTIDATENYYDTVKKIDDVADQAAEINARLRPNFNEDEAYLANHPNTILNWEKRLTALYYALPKQDAQELDKELAPIESEVNKALEELRQIAQSPTLSEQQKKAQGIPLDKKLVSLLFTVEKDTIESFTKKKEKEKNNLVFVTRVTYFLYAIGLLTGILGQLVGIKPEGVDWEP
jgi:hypothetical protein